jgi:spore maturation protein CgeB
VAIVSARDRSAFVPAAHALLTDDEERAALAQRGSRTYAERFALAHTIATLRASIEGKGAPVPAGAA